MNGGMEKTGGAGKMVTRLMSEEEVFDDVPAEKVEGVHTEAARKHDVERGGIVEHEARS